MTTSHLHVFVAHRDLRNLSLAANGKCGFKQNSLFSVQAGRGGDDDYWSENFDKNKNCQQEQKIIELYKKVGVPIKIVLCSIAKTILPFCRKMMVLSRASAQRKWYLS